MADDEIMTLEEVARYLKVKPQTVYKWAQEEQIPGTKLSKEWRFRKSILDEWLNSSILLSKGGFDLMLRSTQRAVQEKSITGDGLDQLLREARE